jgi:hypothetical protein
MALLIFIACFVVTGALSVVALRAADKFVPRTYPPTRETEILYGRRTAGIVTLAGVACAILAATILGAPAFWGAIVATVVVRTVIFGLCSWCG